MALRILVVANKTWECEPLVAALLTPDARPAALKQFGRDYDPAAPDPATGKPYPQPPDSEYRGIAPIRPRLRLTADPGDAEIEVWCIEDWMRKKRTAPTEADPTATADISSSSSHEKFTFTLPQIQQRAFGGTAPDVVIAFGTAGIPTDETLNGCVVMGSRVFVHDPWTGASAEEIQAQETLYGPLLQKAATGWLDRHLLSPRWYDSLFVKDLAADARYAAEARFLAPPISPCPTPRILAGHGYTSVGTINIANYDDYVWADDTTRAKFVESARQHEIGSMETTHGLIRQTWPETAFLYVSAITDRFPAFNAQVTPRKYAQNFVPAHNAGVAVAYLLPELARLHAAGKLLKA